MIYSYKVKVNDSLIQINNNLKLLKNLLDLDKIISNIPHSNIQLLDY